MYNILGQVYLTYQQKIMKNVNKAISNILANNPPQTRKKKTKQKNRNKNKPKVIVYNNAPRVKPKIFKMSAPIYRPIRNEFGFRGMRTSQARTLGKKLKAMHEMSEVEYLACIIEPELALRSGSLIKQPSLVPIPSTTTTFKNNYTLKTDASGSFFLNWVPNFLHTKESLAAIPMGDQGIFANQYTHINTLGIHVGMPSGNNNLIGLKCYTPNISLSKYRLVSAKIRITYIGAAMYNSGFMCGSISYDPAIVGTGWTAQNSTSNYVPYYNENGNSTTTTAHDPIYNVVFNNFDETKIYNGLWPKSTTLKGNGSGMSAVFVPTDPTDEIFYKLGLFYGDKPKFTVHPGGLPKLFPSTSEDGAHSNYYFTGHGWDASKEVIRVETIYNFEIVPTAESAPMLRISDDAPKGVSIPRLRERLRDAIRTGIVYKPKSLDDTAEWELVKDGFKDQLASGGGGPRSSLWNSARYWKSVFSTLRGGLGRIGLK